MTNCVVGASYDAALCQVTLKLGAERYNNDFIMEKRKFDDAIIINCTKFPCWTNWEHDTKMSLLRKV